MSVSEIYFLADRELSVKSFQMSYEEKQFE